MNNELTQLAEEYAKINAQLLQAKFAFLKLKVRIAEKKEPHADDIKAATLIINEALGALGFEIPEEIDPRTDCLTVMIQKRSRIQGL